MKSCELAQFYCCSIVLLKEDTNEYLKQVFRTQHQGNPGLLQTLSVLITEKLNEETPDNKHREMCLHHYAHGARDFQRVVQ